MEDGRPLYYEGNTVKPPRPSAANLKRRRSADPNDLKVLDMTPKVCMLLECVWCGYTFDDYEIYCSVCRLCQYCGMIGASRHACRICGNHVPDDLIDTKTINRVTVY